ncbi:TM2 domain-containing protein 3-like [Oopsacas minuta]|uniref:TM2 domain-containing protein 3-like n=1 Tax=Oopsacas minuta TaxID=111878 RepID=A0AAV7K1J3_9METZ|nr:TM2 domain-containing protein 3-like [Oopsacas minuta]
MCSNFIFLLILTSLNTRLTNANCENRTVCLDSSILNGSTTSLVDCIDSECVCLSECFELNLTSKSCFLQTSSCYLYSLSDDTCHSTAPSWVTAFILSLLFGTTGADNFYINRFDYAIPQLLLFLSPLCGCFTLCSYCYCAMFLSIRKNLRPISMCLNVTALILASLAAIILPLITTSWNIFDIFMFGFNAHFDSNGCTLRK